MNAIATFCAQIAMRQPFNAAAGTRNHSPDANSSPATHVCEAFFLPFRAYIPPTLTLLDRISAPVAASINTAMKGVVWEQTRRKGDDYDKAFNGSTEEARRGTLQAARARVGWSKRDERISSSSSCHSRKDGTFEGASISHGSPGTAPGARRAENKSSADQETAIDNRSLNFAALHKLRCELSPATYVCGTFSFPWPLPFFLPMNFL
jgi:hypothetical protein